MLFSPPSVTGGRCDALEQNRASHEIDGEAIIAKEISAQEDSIETNECRLGCYHPSVKWKIYVIRGFG